MKGSLLLLLAGALWLAHVAEARDMRPGFGASPQAREQYKKKRPDQQSRGQRERRGSRDGKRRNRLTDDERRELHRDLDRAHREIYRR